MIFRWPQPRIDEDWAKSTTRWQEITSLAYQDMGGASPKLHQTTAALMKVEPADLFADNEGSLICYQQENGFCFARLLSDCDWRKHDYLPLPDTDPDIEALFSP